LLQASSALSRPDWPVFFDVVMAKYPTDGSDPYVDPQSGVLLNLLGIVDQAELDNVEGALVAVRVQELATIPTAGRFDLAYLQAIHRHLFGDIYPWAGQIRSVDISKGETRFANHEQIESYAPKITGPLAREQFLQNLDPQEFSERAGYDLGELNALHPFREGNGRAIREFVGQLARGAGYNIDWTRAERSEMTRASTEAYYGDHSRMSRLIADSLREPEREQVFDLAKAVAGKNVQLKRAEPGGSYSGPVIGLTERYIVQSNAECTGEVVLHNRTLLANFEAVRPGVAVHVRYPYGHAGLVEVSCERNASHEVERGDNSRQRREHER